MQYDLWVYRENVGWWLEEEGFALAFAPTEIRKFMKEHKETHPVKLQFALVPSGTPMAVPKWDH